MLFLKRFSISESGVLIVSVSSVTIEFDTGLIELRNKNLKINLLDKKRAFDERTFWQFINIVMPLLILIIFGCMFHYLRKRKYS